MKNTLISILDSNATEGNFLKYHLTIRGFNKVMLFTSPEECFYSIQKTAPPKFIIFNPGSSTKNGLKFLKQVVQIDPTIKFIVFSSNDNEDDVKAFIYAGASDYIISYGNDQKKIRELILNLQFMLKMQV